MKNEVCAIVAMGNNREIGRDNQLLWRVSEDLKRFKSLTMGHPIIMGRKTWESLPKPLPGRTNIVVTRNHDYRREGCIIVHSIQEALTAARASEGGEKVFIIGGGEIYRQSFPHLTGLEITYINASAEADTYFPEINPAEWSLTDTSEPTTTPDGIPYTFQTYKRLS